MIKHPNKILYVGAGLNIMPVKHFQETKHFVFVDSQPRNEIEVSDQKFNKNFYRSRFINDLVETCHKYGFIFDYCSVLDKNYYKKIISKKWQYLSWFYKIPSNLNPTIIVFKNKNTNQIIRYYISTNIRFNMNKLLENDIDTSDGIIVSGVLPNIGILQYFSRPKIFFGYTNTCYNISNSISNDNEDSIIYFLHNFICNTPYYFIEFYMIYYDSGDFIKCENFNSFLNHINEYNKSLIYYK